MTQKTIQQLIFEEVFPHLRGSATESKLSAFLNQKETEQTTPPVNIRKIARAKRYEEKDFGFEEMSIEDMDFIAVYLKVPTFAIHSQFDRLHYLFKETRIGIPILRQGEGIRYAEGVYALKDNGHPLIYHKSTGRLCLGGNVIPTSGKTEGEVIAKRLLRAKEIFMYGYYEGAKINNWQKLEDGKYLSYIRPKFWLNLWNIQIVEGKR